MRADSPTDDLHPDGERSSIPAGAPAWVTRELIDLTIRVWQPYYRALLTTEDALGMLLNAGRLFVVLRETSPRPGL